jgi:hypothetical protein
LKPSATACSHSAASRSSEYPSQPGPVRGERLGQVAEVDQGDDLLRAHLGEQQPQRLGRAAGGQVPARVEDRAGGHVHDAAGRAEPVQRAVADQAPAEPAEVGEDLVQILSGQERLK